MKLIVKDGDGKTIFELLTENAPPEVVFLDGKLYHRIGIMEGCAIFKPAKHSVLRGASQV